MRWRFLDDGLDLAERDRKILDMDRWWLAFEQKVGDLNDMFAGGESFDLPRWMEGIGEVHPDLMWEFGPAIHQIGHRLVITPEHRYELTELVRTFVDRAPQIDGWEFYALRQPNDVIPPQEWLRAAPEDRSRMSGSHCRPVKTT